MFLIKIYLVEKTPSNSLFLHNTSVQYDQNIFDNHNLLFINIEEYKSEKTKLFLERICYTEDNLKIRKDLIQNKIPEIQSYFTKESDNIS